MNGQGIAISHELVCTLEASIVSILCSHPMVSRALFFIRWLVIMSTRAMGQSLAALDV